MLATEQRCPNSSHKMFLRACIGTQSISSYLAGSIMENEWEKLKVTHAALEKEAANLRLDLLHTSRQASDAELVMKQLTHHTLEAARRAHEATERAVTASTRAAAVAKVALEKATWDVADMAAKTAREAAAAAVEAAAVLAATAHAAALLASHETEKTASKAAMEAAAAVEKRAKEASDSAAIAVKVAAAVAEQVHSAKSK